MFTAKLATILYNGGNCSFSSLNMRCNNIEIPRAFVNELLNWPSSSETWLNSSSLRSAASLYQIIIIYAMLILWRDRVDFGYLKNTKQERLYSAFLTLTRNIKRNISNITAIAKLTRMIFCNVLLSLVILKTQMIGWIWSKFQQFNEWTHLSSHSNGSLRGTVSDSL